MLSILYGADRTEVSRGVFDKARTDSLQKNKVYIVVPEQYSFESERKLYYALAGERNSGIEVVSFTSLSSLIFKRYGGITGDYLNDSGRFLLMSLTLQSVKDNLSVYGGHADSPSMTAAMMDAVNEMKYAGISPLMLEDALSRLDKEGLISKISDISLIYNAYQSMIDRSFADPADSLSRMCEVLKEENFFEGASVCFDAFNDFTGAQLAVVQQILRQSGEVCIGLCCPELEEGEEGVFSLVSRCASRLMQMAIKMEMDIALPHCISDSRKSSPLAYLGENYLKAGAKPYGGETENILIARAPDRYRELEFIAAKIKELVRGGMRYRDIAVILRGAESCRSEIRTAFHKHGIPYFMDERKDADTKPLLSLLVSAAEAAARGLRTDEVLRCLKTGLCGVDYLEAAELENYAYIWNISGLAWTKEFTMHPSGLGLSMTKEDAETLVKIEGLRKKAVEPLARLREELGAGEGERSARALYRFLQDVGAEESLRDAVKSLDPVEDTSLIREYSTQYDIAIGVIDQLYYAFKGMAVKSDFFVRMLKGVVERLDFGTIPASLDQVDVGSADRIRSENRKVVFVAGVNEGEFPPQAAPVGLLSDDDRKTLEKSGISLGADSGEVLWRELYAAYGAITTAEEMLIVSYSESDLSGAKKYPSFLVDSLKEIFPQVKEVAVDGLSPAYGVSSLQSGLEEYAKHVVKADAFAVSLEKVLEEDRCYSEKVQAIKSARQRPDFHIPDAGVRASLFGGDLAFSPSQLEKYHQCPFSYYCSYILKVRPLKKAELSPIQSGTAIHFVLERLISGFGIENLKNADDRQIRTAVRDILKEYVEVNFSGLQGDNARLRHLLKRMENTLYKLAKHLKEEFLNSDFVPTDFEMLIAKGELVEPLELKAPDGTSVWVEGKIDRVDVMEKSGRKYVRVVDYKSGIKTFNLTDVYYGINMQMLIYLFAIWEKGKGKYDGSVPAGVLYMPARDAVVSSERGTSPQDISKEYDKMLRMNGLVLDDADIVRGMDHTVSGLFIPVKIGSGGALSGSVATLKELGDIKRHVEDLIVQMASSLKQGDVNAVPKGTGGELPCRFCDYKTVCGVEEDSESVGYLKMKDREVLSMMEGGEAHGQSMDA